MVDENQEKLQPEVFFNNVSHMYEVKASNSDSVISLLDKAGLVKKKSTEMRSEIKKYNPFLKGESIVSLKCLVLPAN